MSWIKKIFGRDTEMEDVRSFHQKFQLLRSNAVRHLTKRKLNERVEFMQEELDEFKNACTTQSLAEQADALIDLVYVAKGTAVMLGLPWEALWDDVQRANMAKARGTTHRGHAVDVTKPPGWVSPKTDAILLAYGYGREEYDVSYIDNSVDERKCHDD